MLPTVFFPAFCRDRPFSDRATAWAGGFTPSLRPAVDHAGALPRIGQIPNRGSAAHSDGSCPWCIRSENPDQEAQHPGGSHQPDDHFKAVGVTCDLAHGPYSTPRIT